MLYRKIKSYIEEHLKSNEDKILLIEGARQIGKMTTTLRSTSLQMMKEKKFSRMSIRPKSFT